MSLGAPRGPLLVIIALAMLAGGLHRDGVGLFAIVLFGAIGLLGCVHLVAGFINRVEVLVEDSLLRASTRPLGRTRTFDTRRVDQIFVTEVHHSRTFSTYALNVRVCGETRLLVDWIYTAEKAFFVERELERRLGITDAPVEGELPRRPVR
jgi:hypothetical protein